MKPTNPAIVSHAAARRLPRLALLLFCLAYLLPGFFGRYAWKSADASALGFMAELAQGSADWLNPTLIGQAAENPAPLAYWLGAWALQWAPAGLAPDFAARLPFMLALALGMLGTWYGTYYLARNPDAQPVAFAFGGEASPKDYARAMADGGLLAFIATLGLAQLAHETTPAALQTAFVAIVFYALAALPYRPWKATCSFALGVVGLTLAGAPTMAMLLGVGGVAIHLLDRSVASKHASNPSAPYAAAGITTAVMVCAMLVAAAIAYGMDLWQWKIEPPRAIFADWRRIAELLLWFTWPVWPLVAWTIWRWRQQIFRRHLSRHLAVPLWMVSITLLGTVLSNASDRVLLLAVPALAALAAFALPTLRREVAALIDWFTLLFFTSCALVVWVVWLAMMTGFPPQPAANVARLAPGFTPTFSGLAFLTALAASLVWGWLVHWRVGRHRTAIWKSLVLPAGGAALCWLLLMTLWLPLLNYTQSYNAMVRQVQLHIPTTEGCVEALGLGEGKIAALQFYGHLQLRPAGPAPACQWLIAEPGPSMTTPRALNFTQWELLAPALHPADRNLSVLVFRRR